MVERISLSAWVTLPTPEGIDPLIANLVRLGHRVEPLGTILHQSINSTLLSLTVAVAFKDNKDRPNTLKELRAQIVEILDRTKTTYHSVIVALVQDLGGNPMVSAQVPDTTVYDHLQHDEGDPPKDPF